MKKRYLIMFLLLFCFNVSKSSDIVCNSVEQGVKYKYNLVEDINYEETIEEINNPERGFYSTGFIGMKETGSYANIPGAKLVHLRANIGDFSKANNGVVDKEINKEALDYLDSTLKKIKNNGSSVIIRFAYDGFNGKGNVEPSLDMILRHIEQVGEVITANQDVVSYVELGFFGPWGEMHTSTICTQVNVKIALDKMLDVLPESIKIGVRTPAYYAHFAGIDLNEIDKNVTLPGERAYRVGLYNDGYLGSESDLGTFRDREKGIKWLESQAKHTLYGGEPVANYASGEPLNTVKYMSKEAFRTHTSYLNREWNYNVINQWKEEIYNEPGSIYDGETGFVYVNNHLGYRYVLRESNVDDEIYENGQIKIKLKVENVGFANMINEKKVTLLLVKDDVVKEIETDIDVRNWNSRENKEVELIVNVPEDIDVGEYKAYLRISKYGDLENDKNYQVVKMANENIWNEEYGANYVGDVKVLEEKTYTINYYLDNVKFDRFTVIAKGKEEELKETYLKEIENYRFIKVEVKDNEINYYYERIVENPDTLEEKTYTMNYYLDNVKFDKFTVTAKGKEEELKKTYLKDIENYRFIKVEVKDNEINYYYERIVENPGTLEEKTYIINYYLDNVKFDKFTVTAKGKEDELKETYLKEIENYRFIKVEVKDNEINYYYEAIIVNPNTGDNPAIYIIILGIGIISFIVLMNVKVKKIYK